MSPLEEVKKIYDFTKNNFSCTDNEDLGLSQPITKTFDKKQGNATDINMLLTAMLMKRDFDAKPMILSTRDNGKANETYPQLRQYNYVISKVNINGQNYFLDASDGDFSFGHLPEKCYNGYARVVDTSAETILLSADSVKDSKLTSVFIFNGDKGMEGNYNSTLGSFKSLDTRKKLRKEKQEDLFNNIKKSFLFDVNISNPSCSSLDNPDLPVVVKYDFAYSNDSADLIYFSPMLTSIHEENPFKSADRLYPVEMPYCFDDIYTLNMEIPKGYTVDELPKSARVALPDNDATFQYTIAKTDTNVQLNCRLKFNKANFDPEDYEALRNFYSYVVKKEDEQIVFKKIK